MNYHCGIAQDSTCNYSSLLSFSVIWINVPFIMKFMLSLSLYHTIYLIIKLSWIDLMFIRFEDYFISIGPFIDTPFNCFTNFKHLHLHDYPLNTIIKPMFCQTLWIWRLLLTPTFLRFLTHVHTTKVLKLWLSTFVEKKN
jgi:hypothetical protein